ncbi:MAG: metallophosphoesterase family protein [Deltaproteobacteria bacterium]|nr:metallophosphoesterase family protein [Deltaproteobacteria bacterium]
MARRPGLASRVTAVVVQSGMLFGLAFASSAGAGPTLTRGPYLQRLTPQSVTVVWRTDAAAACSLAIRGEGEPSRIVEGATGVSCAVEVGGLRPATEYRYAPRADGVGLGDESSFRTDGPRTRFTFLVLGDSGCGCPAQLAVRDRMLASPADFLLHTGDMIYRKILRPEDFDRLLFGPYRELMRRLVLWPCLGNHDRERDDGAIWREVFVTPANNRDGVEDYYSFDYGNAHVVVLDSNAPTGRKSAQRRFLDRDLADSTAPWKFVVLHHTLYSSGGHGSATRLRRNLVPLFDRHRVTAVFMGHDHDYERTLPLRDGAVVAPGAGTVYVTTGGGGKSIRPVGTSGFTAFSESAFHFTRVTVADDTVVIEMVRADGLVRDRVAVPRRSS